MFMVTKTITIMEDAYDLLARNKLQDESFSEEIRRILSKKKTKGLNDFFGILSDEEGESMIKDLKKSREMDLKLEEQRWNY